jgi:ribonuclease BN (tRNA processing enzyme)
MIGRRVLLALAIGTAATLAASGSAAQNATPVQCGTDGVWIQVLGSGAGEFGDENAGPSYLVWIEGRARVLINTGAGSKLRFVESGAQFEDLEAIVFTQLQADHLNDLPAFLRAGQASARSEPLTLLGPEGNERWPGLVPVVARLLGEAGAFPEFAAYLSEDAPTNFRLRVRDVPAVGARRWAEFGTPNLTLAATPVQHGDIPAVAWRVDGRRRSVTVAGSFSGERAGFAAFAQNSDALIVHHAIQEAARGAVRDLYVRPSQIGRFAQQVQPRVLLLTYRTLRTRPFQTQTLDTIATAFTGRTTLANDLQCLGLGGGTRE